MYKYIVFEWIHGSGKSFIPQKLTKKRKNKWKQIKQYHFPNEEELLWKVIRSVVANKTVFDKRQATGLLYAAHANIFHYEHDDDNIIYLLDRHSVTTGLIFQKDIPRQTRLDIYAPGIKALQEKWIVVYIKTKQEIASERKKIRNKKLAKKEQVRKDKANDQFIAKNYDKLSQEYEENLLPQITKLNIPTAIIDNNGTIEETIAQIENKIKFE